MANIKNFGIVGLGSNVQFGKGGAKLVSSEGTFAAKSADNAAFVRFAIANAVGEGDAVTLSQLNAAVAAVSGDFDALQLELDATQAGAGLAADGTYSAPASGALAGATSLKDADDKLAAALVVESAARVAADAVLSNAVAAVDARANAIQTELDVSQAAIGLTPEGALALADGNYLANATTIVAAVEALDAAAKVAADAAAAAKLVADAAAADVIVLDGRVDQAEIDIAALEGNAVAQQGEIDSLVAADVALDGRLDVLEAAVADDTRLVNLESNAVSQQAAIDAAEAAAVLLAGRVTTAEGDIDALETATAANAVAQQTAIDAAAGRLTTAEADIVALEGDMAAAEAAHAALLANAIVKDGSVAFTGNQSMGNHNLTNVADPVNATDAANKGWVETKVAALGNAFNYVTTLALAGEDEASAFDLASLPEDGKNVGDYYKVTNPGFFKLGAQVVYFNSNDGLVFAVGGGFDKIDNTDATVDGTAGQIVVDGNVDTGYNVSIDGAYTAARQLEVTNEANARAAADAILTGAVADVAADLAAEVLDRAADELALANATALVAQNLAAEVTARTDADAALATDISDVASDLAAEVTAREALATATTANAVAQQAAIDALEAAVGDDSRLGALEAKDLVHDGLLAGLESNAAAQDTAIDLLIAADVAHDGRLTAVEGAVTALETSTSANAVAQQTAIDGLVAADVALDTRLDTAEGKITTLEGNAVAQQGEIDALELALENLSQDTITSLNEIYAVHAGNSAVEVTSTEANAKLELTLSDTEARVSVVSTDPNADLRLVAQGTGQVIIGDDGVGIIQADDGYDMTVAAGEGQQTLHLKGAEVSIEDEAGVAIATFVSNGSGKLEIETSANAVSFAAEGVAADLDLIFDPKGAGRVNVSGAKVVNVANGEAATDAVNKGQLDAAVAASEVGHVVSVSGSVAQATANLGAAAITGVVTRIRVVVLNAYNSGATITVGYAGTANALVAATDLDETAAGVYIIETAAEVEDEQLLVTIAGATQGAAKVYVEYIKA